MINEGNKEKKNERVFGLDLLRALAILFVVVGHGAMISNLFLPGFPFIPFPDGVELFFVLSGFLIGTILIKNLVQFVDSGYKFKVLLFFWKRRWYRTLPNYYLALLLNVLVTYFAINSNEIKFFNWKFFFFLQNFKEPFFGFFWESWSLSIEEWFYILFPIVLFGSAVLLKKAKLKHLFFSLTFLFILFPLLYKIYLGYQLNVDGFWWDVQFRKTVLTRLDTIVYGVFFALIAHYYNTIFVKFRWIFFIIGMALLYFDIYSSFDANSMYMKSVHFVVTSLGAALLLPVLSQWKITKHNLFTRFFTWISKISYAIYVLHFALILQVLTHLFPTESKIQGVFLYVIYLVATFGFSQLLYTYFEKPITDLRPKKEKN